MPRFLRWLSLTASLTLAATIAQSASFNFDDDGRLTGVDGLLLPGFEGLGRGSASGFVPVSDSFWNVRFEKGSCTLAFGTCNRLYIRDLARDLVSAGLAEREILNLSDQLAGLLTGQVLVDRPEGNFRSDPNAVAGCNLPGTCQIITFPTDGRQGTETRLIFSTFLNGRRSSPFSIPEDPDDPDGYNLITPLQVYAVFSLGEAPQPAPVPLPAGVLLMLAGLGSLGALRLRR